MADTDTLRLLLGDTDTSDELYTDAQLQSFLDLYGSVNAAAAAAADGLAARFARQVDKQVGDLRLAAGQKFTHYQALAKRLRSTASRLVAPYAGGISVADKQTREQNADRVEPTFTLDGMTNLGSEVNLSG